MNFLQISPINSIMEIKHRASVLGCAREHEWSFLFKSFTKSSLCVACGTASVQVYTQPARESCYNNFLKIFVTSCCLPKNGILEVKYFRRICDLLVESKNLNSFLSLKLSRELLALLQS